MTNGQKIREARKSAGLTQKDIYEWLSIPIRTIQDWEYGVNKPSDWVTNLIIQKIEDEGEAYKANGFDMYR